MEGVFAIRLFDLTCKFDSFARFEKLDLFLGVGGLALCYWGELAIGEGVKARGCSQKALGCEEGKNYEEEALFEFPCEHAMPTNPLRVVIFVYIVRSCIGRAKKAKGAS